MKLPRLLLVVVILLSVREPSPSKEPTQYAGAMRLKIVSAKAGPVKDGVSDIELQFEVAVEPKLKLRLQALWPEVNKAIDQDGRAVKAVAPTSKLFREVDEAFIPAEFVDARPLPVLGQRITVPVKLQAAARPDALQTLAGTLSVQVIDSAPQEWFKIDSVLKAGRKTVQRPDGSSLTFSVSQDDKNGQVMASIDWFLPRAVLPVRNTWEPGLKAWTAYPRVLDQHGKEIAFSNFCFNVSEKGNGFLARGNLYYEATDGQRATQLVFTAIAARSVEVPFRFENVKLD